MASGSPRLADEQIAPDEEAVIREFIAFIEETSIRRHRHGDGPVRRFNQARHSACVMAEFIVRNDLAPEHRVGLFASARTYPARIRFANATSASDREKDVRGMAVSVGDVQGSNLTPGATRQDFLLNSHPVMVVPDTRQFLKLMRAMEAGWLRRVLHLLTHPRTAWIGYVSRKRPTSHLDISYWSATSYLFGPGRAVKYVAQPCSDRVSAMPSALTDTYLRDALREHLKQADACFDFLVQFQTDARRMPIEDASVEWKKKHSPYVPVARIRIPRQIIEDDARTGGCEQSVFNPWHCLSEHRPLGNMNRARRAIYPALSAFREARQ